MDTDEFKVTGRKRFAAPSGKLLIADPYALYPREITELLEEIHGSERFRHSATVGFRHGLLYNAIGEVVDSADYEVSLLRGKEGLCIARRDNVIRASDAQTLFRKAQRENPRLTMDDFLEEEYGPDYRIVDGPMFRRLMAAPMISSTIGLTLLIGDASFFQLPQEEIALPSYDPRSSDHRAVAAWEEYHQRESQMRANQQVLDVPRGVYAFQHYPKQETLVLKRQLKVI
ncbi:MAG: hypothetical protein V1735_04305 [Nanoarchaeota archaeon]